MSQPKGRRALLLALAVTSAAWTMAAETARQDIPPERLAAREWFRDAKLGMFVHWGVYSQLGQGEWVMQNRSLSVSTYEWLASAFNPIKFDAREWVSLARAAGARYITITSRHHDGFSMFATKATRYNIVDWTPYKRDPLKALADECRRQGIKLFFYYSQLDWHHPDFWPRGKTGRSTGRPESGEWTRYLDFMDAQLTELLTNYGPLGGIWFDGMWDLPEADWRLDRTYALIHKLQPAALVVPNHHKAPLPGEDVQTFEQDLPGANTAGFNTKEISSTLPLETSLTMNGAWGFNITDRNFKSVPDLIGYLVRAAGNGGNLLLNVGPRPDGTIQPEATDRLREVGRWLRTYGPSIYDTRGGPIPPQKWGATTRRGGTVYVHVLDASVTTLALPDFGRVTSARMLGRNGEVAITSTGTGLTLTLPAPVPGEIDRVVMLETAR
jgi:alpha-L-fucosidase